MRSALCRWALPTLLLAATPVLVLASPLKVSTADSEAQMMLRCPHCNMPLAGAKTGDYTLGFAADLENPKLGNARLIVNVADKSGAPVNGAKVTVTLSMPEHGHGLRPLTAKGHGNGRYWVVTNLAMGGTWNAEVAVTTPKGDTAKQVFTFGR